MLTAGAKKQDVANQHDQRTQERSTHHVIPSECCQLARSPEPEPVAQTVEWNPTYLPAWRDFPPTRVEKINNNVVLE